MMAMRKAWLLLATVFTVLPVLAQPTKIAVIGLVHAHYRSNLPHMVGRSDVQLVGIAETLPDLIAEAKRIAPDAPFFDDYKKMLDQTKPDVVWAFVENNRHLEIARECAPRKINLIFEKPLASTFKDAQEIAALARRYGIQVMCNYQMAWWPSNVQAKQLVDSGVIGKPWRLHGIVGHGGPGSDGTGKHFFDWLTDPVANGAGALVDFGCYNALWSLWYMGRPESVYAEEIHLRPTRFPKVEDSAALVLRYPTGINVFEASWDLPRGFQDLQIFGSSGTEDHLTRGSVYMTHQKLELRKNGGKPEEIPLTPLPAAESDPIALMVNAIRNHKQIEGETALDINLGVVEIIEAAKESVRTGKAVKLR